MCSYILKGKELCWDKHLWDKEDGVRLEIHHPQEKNVVIKQEEKDDCLDAYIQILKVADKYRMYYSTHYRKDGGFSRGIYYVAESDDGINFTKPNGSLSIVWVKIIYIKTDVIPKRNNISFLVI